MMSSTEKSETHSSGALQPKRGTRCVPRLLLYYNRSMQKRSKTILMVIPVAILLLGIVSMLPPVRSRLDDLRTRIRYALNPPDQAVFVPTQAQLDLAVTQTLAALQATPTHLPDKTMSITPTVTPNPLPAYISLPGVIYVDQHNRWNYCGPANLTMALNFWGWMGNRDDVATVVKPGVNDSSLDFIQRGKPDKNVMPYEMADFVNEHTDLRALYRYGGDIDLLKQLLVAGFPTVVEKGYYERDYTGKVAWLGHYLFVTGYDESQGGFIVQDAWLEPGENILSEYPVFIEGWRSFNYLFLIVYPPEREPELLELLGPWADPAWARQHALDIANQEIQNQTGIDQFFAWFNKGSSHVLLQQYNDAAFAFDYAFSLYAALGQDDLQRPYRIMWYQTGPYWAYFYTGRYQDVINLANTTLYDTISEPTLEESLYWRAMAEFALGDSANAYADMRQTVYLNPNFSPGWQMMSQWGIQP